MSHSPPIKIRKLAGLALVLLPAFALPAQFSVVGRTAWRVGDFSMLTALPAASTKTKTPPKQICDTFLKNRAAS